MKSQSFSVISSGSKRVKRAALFTSPSSRPNCCFDLGEHALDLRDALQIGAEQSARRRTPRRSAAPRPPTRCSGSRPARPPAASRSAMPRPMRLAAPVTRTILPVKLAGSPCTSTSSGSTPGRDRLGQPAGQMRPAPEYRRRWSSARPRSRRSCAGPSTATRSPAAIIESIITDHCSDSMVENTRPRNSSGTMPQQLRHVQHRADADRRARERDEDQRPAEAAASG